jgi:hypothetical protein
MDAGLAASLGRAMLFMGIPFILSIFWLQWKWARICENNIQLLIAQQGGSGKYTLAPKDGGQVTILNPISKEIRTWPVNELATIDITYPGVGFVPKWMQKTIRMAIVNEGDWEPMLNRSPHRKMIASPDVVEYIRDFAVEYPVAKGRIEKFLKEISTGPTREMIADPSMLGALNRSSVMKALATVSDELMEEFQKIRTQLARFAGLNSTVIYIGLGLTVVLVGFLIYQVMQMIPALEQIDKIGKAMGVQ